MSATPVSQSAHAIFQSNQKKVPHDLHSDLDKLRPVSLGPMTGSSTPSADPARPLDLTAPQYPVATAWHARSACISIYRPIGRGGGGEAGEVGLPGRRPAMILPVCTCASIFPNPYFGSVGVAQSRGGVAAVMAEARWLELSAYSLSPPR